MSTRTTEPQLSKITHRYRALPLLQPSEMAAYQILGSKTVKNVQIDSQTTELWLKQLKTSRNL